MWWRKSVIKQDLRKDKVDIQHIANIMANYVLNGDGVYTNSLLEQNSDNLQHGPGADLMAWLSNNAKELCANEVEEKIRESTKVLLDEEKVVMAYKVGHDSTLLTTKRL